MRRIIFLVFVCVLMMVLAVSAQAPPGPTNAPGLAAAIQQGPPEPPPAEATTAQLAEKADVLRARKSYDQALVYYSAALRKDPNNSVLYNKRGIAELQLNNLAAAQKDFQRAVKKNQHYAEAYNNLGVVSYMQRNYKNAIQRYEKALRLREDSASVHSNLGTAWFAQRQIDKAMAEYARALELDPDVLLRSSTGGVAARILSPEDRAYYSYVLAKMYAKRGDVERCLECLRKAKEEGYGRIRDAYKDAEFVIVRADPRFVELMGKPAPQE
ncbi:MAG: tetratricopeptide repeat protein [Terriglobales bacterium]|jgi:tetratricopeptide (TPR) repeat protein